MLVCGLVFLFAIPMYFFEKILDRIEIYLIEKDIGEKSVWVKDKRKRV